MDVYTACEQAYKNGFEAGRLSVVDLELITRVKVAYEQLSKCHTALCRMTPREADNSLLESLRDVLIKLLTIQDTLNKISTK